MDLIKRLIESLNSMLHAVETEIAPHHLQAKAAAAIKEAATALAGHPANTAQPSTIVSPGKTDPVTGETAPVPAAAPANDAPLTDNDPIVKSGAAAA